MPFVIQEGYVGVQAIADVSDTQRHPLGLIVDAVDPVYGAGEFIYLKGLAATALGNAVVYNTDDYTTTRSVAGLIGPVAFAMAPVLANQFGWYQIQGKAIGTVLAGFLDNANVYLTATAGALDDAVVAGDRVKNCKGASNIGIPAAGLAELKIARPWVDAGLAA